MASNVPPDLEWKLRVAKRRELLDHVDPLLRPPAQFYSELEISVERRFCSVAER